MTLPRPSAGKGLNSPVLWLIGFGLFALSLGYHARVPFLWSRSDGWIGVGLIIASFLWVIVFRLRSDRDAPEGQPFSASLPVAAKLFATPLLPVALFVYFRDLTTIPIWTSEAFVVNAARRILAGTLVHPIGRNGDFPSNFMSWTVAPLLFITQNPKLAVRLVGVLCLLATAAYLWKLAALVLRSDAAIYAPLFLVFSLWSLHLCYRGDNNWLSAVPLLVVAQLYYLVRGVELGSLRSFLSLALAAGVAFWTLYMPCVFAIIVGGVVVCLPTRVLSWKAKAAYALCFLVIVAPVLGYAYQFPHLAIGRHASYILKRGEGGVPGTFLAAYASTARQIVGHFLPDINRAQADGWALLIEPTTLLFFLSGLLFAVFVLRFRVALLLYLTGVLAFAGIVVSNPVASFWREIILMPFVFLFAAVGCHVLSRFAERLLPSRGKAVAGVIFCGLHFFVAYSYYLQYRRFHLDPAPPTGEWVAEQIYGLAKRSGRTIIYMPPGYNEYLVGTLSRGSMVALVYHDLGQVPAFAAGGQYLVAVVLDRSKPQEPAGERRLAELEEKFPAERTSSADGRIRILVFKVSPLAH